MALERVLVSPNMASQHILGTLPFEKDCPNLGGSWRVALGLLENVTTRLNLTNWKRKDEANKWCNQWSNKWSNQRMVYSNGLTNWKRKGHLVLEAADISEHPMHPLNSAGLVSIFVERIPQQRLHRVCCMRSREKTYYKRTLTIWQVHVNFHQLAGAVRRNWGTPTPEVKNQRTSWNPGPSLA